MLTFIHSLVILFLSLGFYMTGLSANSTLHIQEQHQHYWIGFSDKTNTPYCISKPETFLGDRAIERRIRHDITISEEDLPVDPQYVLSVASHPDIDHVYSSRWFNGMVIQTPMDLEALQVNLTESFIKTIRLIKPIQDHSKKSFTTSDSLPTFYQQQGIDQMMNGFHQKDSHDGFVIRHALFQHDTENQFIPYSLSEKNINDSITALYGYSSIPFEQLNASILHAGGNNGEGVHIAIFDAGFRDVDTLNDFAHLHVDDRILGTFDFVNPGNDVYREHTHGTRVLSAMAAFRPGVLYGSAKNASYWLLRTEEVSSEYLIEEYNWLAAAEFVDSAGVDIINSSLGYTRFDEPLMNYRYEDLDGHTTITAIAANMAFSRGILVVNSAGNYANDLNWQYIGTPADAPGTLSVGAIDNNRLRTNFSSVGPTADGRIKPDVMALGRGVPVSGGNHDVSYASGTSFAAPIIAGLAACLWQNDLSIPASDIKRIIIESSDQYHAPDSLYGFGVPNFHIATNALQTLSTFTPPNIHCENEQIKVFPNPITFHSYVLFYSAIYDVVSFEIINASGQIIYSLQDVSVKPGQNIFQPFHALGTMNNGIYQIRMYSKQQMASSRILLLP